LRNALFSLEPKYVARNKFGINFFLCLVICTTSFCRSMF